MYLSQSEENYLKSVYSLSIGSDFAVSTNLVAENLNTKASSVTEMIKKLSRKNLLSYQKYKGSTLTKLGKSHALKIIRKHRLWETFLVDKLNFTWDEVHEIAEQLEHIQSEKLTNRLSELLNNPKYDPHGDPIPDENGKFPNEIKTKKLNELAIGESGIVHHISIDSQDFLKFLTLHDIKIGSVIMCKDKFEFDHSMTVLVDDNQDINLSKKVNKNIVLK